MKCPPSCPCILGMKPTIVRGDWRQTLCAKSSSSHGSAKSSSTLNTLCRKHQVKPIKNETRETWGEWLKDEKVRERGVRTKYIMPEQAHPHSKLIITASVRMGSIGMNRLFKESTSCISYCIQGRLFFLLLLTSSLSLSFSTCFFELLDSISRPGML